MVNKIPVSLLCNIPQDGSTSMHLYKQDVLKHFSDDVDADVVEPNIFKNWFFIFSYKHLIYPFRPIKSNLIHILDQSYGHLLYFHPFKKKIITCHDIIPIVYPKASTFIGRILFRAYTFGFRFSDKVLTISENTKQDLVNYCNLDPKKIEVITYGIDSFFHKVETNSQDETRKFILAVGHVKYKNILGVLKCLNELVKIDRKFHLLKINKLHPDELEFIKKNNLEQHITVYQKLNSEEIREMYSMAKVLLFPSFYEGFGRPILEAMACECPVVTSNRASIPEVAGNAAILVDPDNIYEMTQAVLKLTMDMRLREEYISKGLNNCKRFSWKKHTREIEEIYRKVLKN
jgi:glycosyltransferase involved in cell wall biosynthesis